MMGLIGRDRWAMAAIMLAVVLGALDTAIVNTALPQLALDLQVSPAASVWVISAYQLTVVASLLPLAALGDQWGPKRVFLGGVALYSVASLGCALAHSLPQLAAARMLQGLGSAGVMSINIALVQLIYPPERLGRGVGMNALVVGLGATLGPTVASLVLSVASWPWLFLFNVPLALIALLLGLRFIPEGTKANVSRVDVSTAVFAAGTFGTLVFGLSWAAQRGSAGILAVAVGLFVVFGAALLIRQKGHPAPMLPVDLFRRPLFALSTITSACSFTVQGLAFVSLPFYLQTVLHRSAVETGFLLAPWALAVALAAPFAGRLSDKYPPGLLGGVGLSVLSLGMVSMTLLTPEASTPDILLRMLMCGVGFGFFQSPNLKAMMSAAPRARGGSASGMIALARQLGQTTGAALVALCLGWGGLSGTTWALGLGAGFAAVGSAVSFARLRYR
jgi:DHA2 family multidrug resistance protein-like MFS transporter